MLTTIHHPLIDDELSHLRDPACGPQEFRQRVRRVASMMVSQVTALAIALAAPCARGDDARAAEARSTEIRAAADDAYQMALWDVATRKYQALLADGAPAPDDHAALTLRLAECLVRDGRAADALVLLEGDIAAEAAFWRAQSLAGLGRFGEAVAEFDVHLADANAPHRLEAALTSSNLQLSLDNASGAVATLAAFAESAPPAAAARADLQRAAILLDSGYPDDARELLPEEDVLPPSAIPDARYIRARLLLAGGDAEAAAGWFATLLDDPTGQSLTTHHGAALGLADAIHVTSGPEAATRSLLTFVGENPATPLLDAAFRRVLRWLPENPATTDPTLAKLAEWIPHPPPATTGFIPQDDSAAAAWPIATPMEDIAAFAMFTRAIGLHRVGSAAARDEARQLMSRLRANFPGHFLVRRSLLVEARWLMSGGEKAAALHRLDVVADTSLQRASRGEALFLQAMALAGGGDEESAARFEEAADLFDGEFAEAARFNAALARIRENTGAAEDAPELTSNLRAQLMLERALATSDPAASVAALESFLRDYPAHPRAAEARLAAAERALLATPPNVSFAHAQVETLLALDETAAATLNDAEARIALVQLRIADQPDNGTVNGDEAIDISRRIIAENPDTAVAVEATLTLGRNLFQSGNFNEARITFERLALDNAEKDGADPSLTQAAWVLAARAAALGATAQSRDEALTLFDRAIAVPGDAPLRGIAKLEKARLMIDLNRLAPAIDFLREARSAMGPADPLDLPAGLLLGEAIYATGAGDPGALAEALAIYDDLLARAEDHPSLYHRLQYLRGITLEKLPHPESPGRKRDAEAIAAYYSVIQRADDGPPAEWEWFERCAFGALALLEKDQRWQAAINLARKIASFNGPRAADAADRANQLQLKHMIWED